MGKVFKEKKKKEKAKGGEEGSIYLLGLQQFWAKLGKSGKVLKLCQDQVLMVKFLRMIFFISTLTSTGRFYAYFCHKIVICCLP